MDDFKRIGGLVWRGALGLLCAWLFLTRLADLLIPSARAGWVGFCAGQSISYAKVVAAQLLTVVLSGWLIWVHWDKDRFKSRCEKMEYHGIYFAGGFITWHLYSMREKIETGRVVKHAAEYFNGNFGVAIFMLVLCLGMNPAIEFLFREKKEERVV